MYPTTAAGLRRFDAPSTDSEIFDAFHYANQNASPDPDGFGPGFYKRSWRIVKPIIKTFLSSFFNRSADLTRINSAHIVLIPKKESVRTPDTFRPISLQDGPMKASAKLLTNCLKPLIPMLVDGD